MATFQEVRVVEEDFSLDAEASAMRLRQGASVGGYATFVGLVRGEPGVDTVLHLEHYPGMTERALEEIVTQAKARWPLQGVRVIHRHGPLAPGDRIVLVLAASRHREAAFEAAAFLMDFLKTRAPFWKKESGLKGAQWVDAREADDKAAARWGTGEGG